MRNITLDPYAQEMMGNVFQAEKSK